MAEDRKRFGLTVLTVERGQLARFCSGRFQHEVERRRGDRVMIGGDLERCRKQLVGVFDFPGNQPAQGVFARAVGFFGIVPGRAEDSLRRVVTIELGEAGDRGHADAGFGALDRVDQGGAKGFVAITDKLAHLSLGRRRFFPLPGRRQGLGDLRAWFSPS